MELLTSLNRDQGITIIMVTHEPDMAAYAKRIVHFRDGLIGSTMSQTERISVMLWNTLLLALREIRRNVMRSFLTMLGIVIGVAAVIIMVTIGGGATAQVRQQIASMGSNLLMVSPGKRLGPGQSFGSAPFKQADAEAILPEDQLGGGRGPGLIQVRPGHLRQRELVDHGHGTATISTFR